MPEPKTCYMCSSPATSREHAPPQCFFPRGRRDDPITVPSCDDHNSKKSKDDEYVRLVVAVSYQTNEQGHKIVFATALRGLRYSPHLFKEFLFKGPVFRGTVNGEPSMGFTIDRPRIKRVFDHMARAIFCHHWSTKWVEQLDILPASGVFPPTRPNFQQQNARLADLTQRPFPGARHGQNQDIFYYQFLTDEPLTLSILKMVLYDGFVVFAIPRNRRRRDLGETSSAPDPMTELSAHSRNQP